MERLPIIVFRYTWLGLIVEFTIIAMLIAANWTMAWYLGVLDNLAEPFYDNSTATAAKTGAISWVFVYAVVLLIANVHARHDDICYPFSKQIVSIAHIVYHLAHIVYHLLRWPLFFGLAAPNITLLTLLAYWVDLLLLGGLALLAAIGCAARFSAKLFACCSQRLCGELDQMRRDRGKPDVKLASRSEPC